MNNPPSGDAVVIFHYYLFIIHFLWLQYIFRSSINRNHNILHRSKLLERCFYLSADIGNSTRTAEILFDVI